MIRPVFTLLPCREKLQGNRNGKRYGPDADVCSITHFFSTTDKLLATNSQEHRISTLWAVYTAFEHRVHRKWHRSIQQLRSTSRLCGSNNHYRIINRTCVTNLRSGTASALFRTASTSSATALVSSCHCRCRLVELTRSIRQRVRRCSNSWLATDMARG